MTTKSPLNPTSRTNDDLLITSYVISGGVMRSLRHRKLQVGEPSGCCRSLDVSGDGLRNPHARPVYPLSHGGAMLIKTLDFQFRKQAEGYRLGVYPRDSSQLLVSADFNLSRPFLNGSESKHPDFDARDPAGRVARLREFGRKLHQQIFTPEVARIWSEHKRIRVCI